MTATWQASAPANHTDQAAPVPDGADPTVVQQPTVVDHPTVVVAVDGRPASVAALEWARQHLIGPDDTVVAVTAHVLPVVAPETMLSTHDIRVVENTARVDAEEALRAVFGASATRIHHVVEAGTVEQLLERYADDNAIVVAGAPVRRRLRDRLRPSGGRRLANRFHCPVIIVPELGAPTIDHSRETASAS